MLDFRRQGHARTDRLPSGERRLLTLLCAAALVVLLVLRVAGPHGQNPARPGVAMAPRQARIGQLALADDARSDDEKQGVPHADKFFPGVRRDYLAEVRDDTMFRATEKDAWFHLLALLDETGAG